MSTENFGEAKKAKPFLRKTKFILEKIEKLKFWGVLLKMAWPVWQEKNYYFYWLEWLLVLLLFMVYIFSICWPRGEEKKKVYIIRKEIIKQFFKL